jgi:hypothetical protein
MSLSPLRIICISVASSATALAANQLTESTVAEKEAFFEAKI